MLWADILITENISANKTNLKKKKLPLFDKWK